MKKIGSIIVFFLYITLHGYSSPSARMLTLYEAVEVLSLHTSSARALRLDYENKCLEFENYKRSFLPAVSFAFSPFSFNRSIQRLQQPSDGVYTYIEDYSNSSSAGLTVMQKLGPIGGSLRMGSKLKYLREFSQNKNTFNTNPFFVSYNQPLLGGRKNYLFNQTIQHLNNQIAQKNYGRSVATLQQQVLSLFLNLFLSKLSLEQSRQNALSSDTLLQIAKVKLHGGLITEYDYNQLELQSANNDYLLTVSKQNYEKSMRDLCTKLELDDSINVPMVIDASLPFLVEEDVRFYVRQNSSVYLEQELRQA